MYPDVGGEFLEELTDWQSSCEKQEEYLSFLIEVLTAAPDVSAERLKEHLRLTNRLQIYDALSAELEMLYRKKILPTEAKNDIAALLRGMHKKNLRSELLRLAEQIADADGENAARLWERYQSLLKEEKETE